MKDETSQTIIENLIGKYIYIFGAQKTIFTGQGQNFLSELIRQLEEGLLINHVKTTAFHPQANGNVERMYSTFTNLRKTAFAENSKEWDKNIKFINFSINTMRNETTGFSPYEITFGRDPNILSIIPNSPTSTLQEVIKK